MPSLDTHPQRGRAPGRGRAYRLACACAVAAALALAAAMLALSVGEAGAQEEGPPSTPDNRPNFVFVVADDMAKADLRYMPKTRALLGSRGTTFENAFVTFSLCCPSRATILRGQYPHNHRVLSNSARTGGAPKFRRLGLDRSTVATWLDDAGYETAHFGKYLNGYGVEGSPYLPPGWDRWETLAGAYDETGGVNECARGGPCVRKSYGRRVNWEDHFSQRVRGFIRGAQGPFYAQVGSHAPHAPHRIPPRHAGKFKNAEPPRYRSFNEADVSDKPRWVRDEKKLRGPRYEDMVDNYRGRLRSLQALDDMVASVVKALGEEGELSNTYLVFTSDNGFHYGEHRLTGKWTPYEEAQRVPLLVRGPGVPEGGKRRPFVLNNDLAPTFADLAGAQAPGFVDGRSIQPLFNGAPRWRNRFLVEGYHERLYKNSPPTYKSLRTRTYAYTEYATKEKELYDLTKDPYQLDSRHERANKGLLRSLDRSLTVLSGCHGSGCRAAEGG